jgi:cold shock CspA family protein
MLSGIISRLVPDRRLGYVRPTTGGVPLIFKALTVEGVRFNELVEGQAVTYTLERDLQGRGPRAIHVRPVACPLAGASSVQ